MNAETCLQIKSLSEKIATELVFAEAERDGGLLPVNCLLIQVEELTTGQDLPESLADGLHQARLWLDGIFDTTGVFSSTSLRRLGQWIEWWQAAFTAWIERQEIVAAPADWKVPSVLNAATVSTPTKTNSLEIMAGETEPVLTLRLAEDREFLAEFVNEAVEHLQSIEQGVLVLEDNPKDADTLNSIFRAFHTFKGGAGFLNLIPIQRLAHDLESLLDQARQSRLEMRPKIINLILEGSDTLKRFTNEINAQIAGRKLPGPILIPTLALLEKIRAALIAADQNDTSSAAATIVPTLESSEIGSHLVAPISSPTLKVDTLKLDGLVDLVGEMVVAQSLVARNPDLTALQSEQLLRDLTHLGRITKELQRTAMSLRMVPIRPTFQKMNRVVRDLGVKVGKKVELVTEGEETEMDRTIVEQINDPLVHMIRNSIDHGLELPEVRRKRGKAEQGRISLRAFHQAGNVVIEVRDDGNGLNRDRILARAIERGIASTGDRLGDTQIFNLICTPGFSTAEKITDISGRGVGMDVVKENIEKLRGKLTIRSTPGQGSVFTICLPLTLAIIDGLLVTVGGQRFVIPTLSIRESFRPTADKISVVKGRGELVEARGKLCPLMRLYEHLEIQPTTTDPTKAIMVLVEVENHCRCIMVDDLVGKQELVVKSLGENFRRSRFVSGAAILGDGQVGLILDPQTLVFLDHGSLEVAA